jgi:hypothetical protein
MQIANRCAPWKISNGAENFVLQALQFQYMVVCCKHTGGASMRHSNNLLYPFINPLTDHAENTAFLLLRRFV